MRPLVSLPLALAATIGLGLLTFPLQAGVALATPTAAIGDSPIDAVVDSAQGPDGKVYVVGGFSQVGAATGGFTRLSASSAEVDRAFHTVNGRVLTSVVDPSGAIYLGGDFVSVGGQPRQDLARINPDGSLDESWGPTITANNSYVADMALSNGTLFIGGTFTGVSGEARQNLAAIDTVTGEPLSWSPAPNYPVTALATDSTSLYVGGSFTSPRLSLVSYDLADLSLRTGWNSAGANSQVSDIVVMDDSVFVSGYFTNIAGVGRSGLAALDASTGAASPWDPAVGGGSVDTMSADDSILYIGGSFRTLNGGTVTQCCAAAINTDDTGTPTSWNPNMNAFQSVMTITVADADVYLGGNFTSVGGTSRINLARVDKSTGTLDNSWNARVPTTGAMFARTIIDQGPSVLVGGDFTHVNAIDRLGAAAFDSDTRVTDWNPDISGEGYGIEIAGATAYVVGNFNTVNGSVARDYAAAFRTDDTGTVTAWDPQPNSYPYDLLIDGDLAYLVGDFGDVGGSTRNYAAAVRIDDAGSVTGWDPDLDSTVFSIALDGDIAYLAGDFNYVNQSTTNTSRYTAAAVRTDDTGTVTAWDPDPDSNAAGVTVSDGIVYLVGAFQYVKASTTYDMRYGAAAFTTDGAGEVTDWDPFVDGGTPFDITIVGDYAYMGGDFANVNGGAVTARGLVSVSIDDTGTAANDWTPVASGFFEYGSSYEGGLAVVDGGLAVMGSFRMATLDGADYPGGLSVLPIPGSPTPPSPTPTPGVVANPPRDARAEAGDRSADVSWLPPVSSGSFAVSTYQVVASPGGRTCLTSSLTCTVEGLSNGTAYTFTVRALNGAGWSAASDPSNAVTPSAEVGPSVTITGAREGKRIAVSGTASGFGMGGTLRPWVRTAGQTSFTEGSATILVSVDGTFEWGRRTGKKVSVYVATPDGSVRSNTVRIAAR